jgi:predicted DNA binding CopG/RHH family protein
MREEYDFTRAKRAAEVPHLAQLQAEAAGKTRITMRVDTNTLLAFKAQASATGGSYQKLMNAALGDYLKQKALIEAVRETIQEELHHLPLETTG